MFVFMFLCMYAYFCEHFFVCMCFCVFVSVHLCVCMLVCLCLFAYVCSCMSVCICLCMCLCVCLCIHSAFNVKSIEIIDYEERHNQLPILFQNSKKWYQYYLPYCLVALRMHSILNAYVHIYYSLSDTGWQYESLTQKLIFCLTTLALNQISINSKL